MNRISSSNGSETERPRRGRKGAARKRARPLDETSLRDLALSYAARFATTGAKLEAYLARKIRERGVAEDGDGRTRELDVKALVARLAELGYVDDEAYARMKTRDLTGRGYGARRVEQALWAAGVEEEVRAEHAPGELQSREAAVLMAKKRRFGPFGDRSANDRVKELDPVVARKLREKQLAAMLRAGHAMDHVRFIIDAQSAERVEEWLAEAEGEDPRDEY
ncbi:regulatory protein RecX [Erythrobacter sp. GH1-10]|uniref:regulatory protein RecX n=1 Tax=Erythrobacter sp. GH1-10 TaxID=3349334 RepID=UPI003877E8A1